ncbi:OprD family outer membrane porin, partial [Pseudomonas aeruginosa]|uniref:OprD family outer membrane porin n=1 Tax=Pseudomonas aeruginosa TaxID=287 RepID=UPI003CC6C073
GFQPLRQQAHLTGRLPLNLLFQQNRPLQGSGGKHWERDLDLRYVFASGPLKDLSLNVSHLSHRANAAQAGDDIDRLYLIVEYPLKGSL